MEDLDIDLCCRHCGTSFTKDFSELPDGRAVKCPSCHGTYLAMDFGTAPQAHAGKARDAGEGKTSRGSARKRDDR